MDHRTKVLANGFQGQRKFGGLSVTQVVIGSSSMDFLQSNIMIDL